jgi:hypothetical protein
MGGLGDGTFKITPEGALTTLHNFIYIDGGQPTAALVQVNVDGVFFGTTAYGGSQKGHPCLYPGCPGTVFKITPQGALTTLAAFRAFSRFDSPNGLIEATDGNLYATGNFFGTTFYSGDRDLVTARSSVCL